MRVYWEKVPTTVEVYRLLLATHASQLQVFESFSDPEGAFTGHQTGEMQTVWGLNGADAPLVGARSTWDVVHYAHGHPLWPQKGRENEKHEFWLCKPVAEERQ